MSVSWWSIIPDDVRAEINSIRMSAENIADGLKYCDSGKDIYRINQSILVMNNKARAIEWHYAPIEVKFDYDAKAIAAANNHARMAIDQRKSYVENKAKAVASAISQLN